MFFSQPSDEAETDNFVAVGLQNDLISEHLGNYQSDASLQMSSLLSSINFFDQPLSLAALFAATQEQDSERFAFLSDTFEKRNQEIATEAAASRIVLGSSISVTSGLSIGYFLYLLRGGAIMSSMLSSLPAWRFIDPLPILSNLQGSLDSDDESLQSMVSEDQSAKSIDG